MKQKMESISVVVEPDEELKDKAPPWIACFPIYRKIWKSIHLQDRNFMIANCGQTGTGKSRSGLKLALELDWKDPYTPRFKLKRLVFSAKKFVYYAVKANLEKGNFIVWDEVGVAINARQWYSLKNLLVSYVTQTFRYRNLGIIVTVPAFSYIDKQVRGLFHGLLDMKAAYPREGFARGKWYWVRLNSITGEIKLRKERIFINGQPRLVEYIELRPIPRWLDEAYEEKKKKYLEGGLYEYIMRQIEEMENQIKKLKRKVPLEKLVEHVRSNLDRYYDKRKRRFRIGLIMRDLGVPQWKAYEITRVLRSEMEAGLL